MLAFLKALLFIWFKPDKNVQREKSASGIFMMLISLTLTGMILSHYEQHQAFGKLPPEVPTVNFIGYFINYHHPKGGEVEFIANQRSYGLIAPSIVQRLGEARPPSYVKVTGFFLESGKGLLYPTSITTMDGVELASKPQLLAELKQIQARQFKFGQQVYYFIISFAVFTLVVGTNAASKKKRKNKEGLVSHPTNET